MHILNNFLAFGYALPDLNVSEAGWGNVPLTLVQSGTYAVLVLLVTRKMGPAQPHRPAAPGVARGAVQRRGAGPVGA